MVSSKRFWIPVVAVGLLSAGAVTAGAARFGPDGDRGPGHHPRLPISIADAEARAAERFGQVDADADGLISLDELSAAEFGDGDMRGPRARHHRPGPAKRRGPDDESPTPEQRAEREQHIFEALDADGDGQLSSAEFANRDTVLRSLRRQKMFTHLDANADGMLDASEFPPMLQRLKKMDTNSDGEVTRDEFRRGGPRHRSRDS